MKNKFKKEYAKLHNNENISESEYRLRLRKLINKYCDKTTGADIIATIMLSKTRFFEV